MMTVTIMYRAVKPKANTTVFQEDFHKLDKMGKYKLLHFLNWYLKLIVTYKISFRCLLKMFAVWVVIGLFKWLTEYEI